LRLSVYASVSLSLLALPMLGVRGAFTASAASLPASASPMERSLEGDSRPEPIARARSVLTQSPSPMTQTRDGPPEVQSYTVAMGDTLVKIAVDFNVTVETVAYNNGVTDVTRIHSGTVYRIPSIDAAIYPVTAGDTVDAVAARFRVDPKTIMETNRLYFEPENFAPGKEILVPVPGGRFPNFELKAAPKLVRSSPGFAPLVGPAPGRLGWPVRGVLTQYFWYGHKGVDIGAPYGAGIAASDAGVVSIVGWHAVGGLRVCVRHDWGMETCYYHTSAVHTAVGQTVAKGQIIASVGLTGVTTGPHVHWEARYRGVMVNPLTY
jgi:murein DD-endopeptidase MepM/ murein hydrolase activator NlpD